MSPWWVRHDLRGNLLLSRSPDHPDAISLGRKALRQIGVIGGGPALGWPDRARRECHHRTAIGCEPQPFAPRRQFGPGTLSSGNGQRAGASASSGQSEGDATVDHARQAALAEAQIVDQAEASFSPTNPVRSGTPARAGANADFQVRGITSTCP